MPKPVPIRMQRNSIILFYIKINATKISNQSRSNITIRIYYDEKLFTHIKRPPVNGPSLRIMFLIYVFTESSVFMSIFGCEKALSTSFFPQSSHTLTWKFTSMEDGRQQIMRWWWPGGARTRAPRFHATCGSELPPPPCPLAYPAPAFYPLNQLIS